MISLNALSSKSYYVVGLARSGQATVKALRKAGAKVFVFDDSVDPIEPDYITPEEINWSTLDGLILSPGIPHTFPRPHRTAELARAHNVPIVCDIDLLAQACPKALFVGITGTNGKSTTTALLHHLLPDSHMGGNIGVPVLSLEADPEKADELFLLELSSYQLERVPHLKCALAVWLNITPDHLDRHGDFQGYVEAKRKLFLPFGDPQTVIIGVDDETSFEVYESLKKDASKKVIPISVCKILQGGVSVVEGILYDQGQKIGSVLEAKGLLGIHNHQNIAAAYGVLKTLRESFSLNGVTCFKGLPHRQEYVACKENVTFINDSKATNITSTLRALSCYKNVHLVLGGIAKESGLSSLEQEKDAVAHAYVFGQAASRFSQELTEKGIPYSCFKTLEEAAQKAAHNAFQEAAHSTKSTTVLLSPACSSFDQFKDFEKRGETFKAIIHDLINRQEGSVSHG
ncbi:MAG TPA: UDP-N-acetylmuramoyl-L-alanine--D-glutamate ligase [Holosporales bacterium]|nr:UDP-N-acetylmuramoyl-L-alanine--D-glutamate ligase [Holosporales bacterium]